MGDVYDEKLWSDLQFSEGRPFLSVSNNLYINVLKTRLGISYLIPSWKLSSNCVLALPYIFVLSSYWNKLITLLRISCYNKLKSKE